MEFTEVMKQFRRMMEAKKKGYGIPAYANYNCAYNHPEDFEKEVMAWAAEHPETQFPTWGEFLCNIGLIHDCTESEDVVSRLFHEEIPAEIAQKLGLKPKEGK